MFMSQIIGCFFLSQKYSQKITFLCLKTKIGLPSWHWRRKQQPTPIFLPGESHGQRRLADYSPWGCTESDTTEVTQHVGRHGTVDRSPPANARDTGSIPGPGIFHILRSNKARVPQLLSLCVATTEAHTPRACALQKKKPSQ